ncbi:MAG: 30S ribosomal protein S27ae [Thermofilum sp. ex4484_82]|nr:MAG: 30S ribosomal protein S27ae [Thermofilum sp. ex4484_82]OYT39193.1 MAG: 30S ribosomal protein S27ae [Archaeoglobales archaeon ex4484_92]
MSKAHERYKWNYEKGTIELKNRVCPRCGAIMAHHKTPRERWHCGRCGFTIFVSTTRS